MELILKREGLKTHLYARNASQTLAFLNACFFFVRQYRPLINQIIFQKHCFNYTTLLNKLILYQEAMKFNMYEV